MNDESNVEKDSSGEAEATHTGGNKRERALFKAIKAALIEEGIEHGHANVAQLPGGGFAAVAGEGELESASFTPGGGGFGGGGASGKW